MTGSNCEKSLRERLITTVCLALAVSVGIIVAPRSEAQTAQAQATIQYTVTSSGWMLGTTSDPSGGQNYESGFGWTLFSGPSPWSVQASVYFTDSTDWSELTANIVQQFVQDPDYIGVRPSLNYTVTKTAYAYIGAEGQNAKSSSQDSFTPTSGPAISTPNFQHQHRLAIYGVLFPPTIHIA